MDKVIHYCWFGNNRLSAAAERSLASWKQFAPNFTIRRWDESNFDIDSSAWAKAAYEAGKWAFVSDYARFKVLYNYGGIYMDVGSELIRDITPLLEFVPFTAIEELSLTATTGLIVAVEARDPIIGRVLEAYESMTFDDNPEYLLSHTVNELFTSQLEHIGFRRVNRNQRFGDWLVLESAAFNPVYGFGGYHIKEETYSIHHYSGSWVPYKYQVKRRIVEKCSPFIGRRAAQVIGRSAAEIADAGVVGGFKNLLILVLNKSRDSVADR